MVTAKSIVIRIRSTNARGFSIFSGMFTLAYEISGWTM